MTNHSITVFAPELCQPFERRVENAIRQIRRSAEGLTPAESQTLSDMSRGRGLAALSRVADIARYRCRNPADAAALGEAFRMHVLTGHPGLCLPFIDTLRYEGQTNAMADEAIIEHVLSPSKATVERVVETHNAQAIASRAVADLMLSTRGIHPLLRLER